jgi:hypothetical protein
MAKHETVGRPISEWTFNYADLARISGKTLNTIQASKRRPGGFDPDDLLSVFLWLSRNATADIKWQVMQHMVSIPVVIDTKPRKKKAGV